MNKLFSSIKQKKHFYIACLILCIAFAFSRLPFFIWMPLPIISPDTFDYYAIVQQLMNGTFKGFGILPPGLILFLYLMELLFTKTIYILIVQNIISLLVSVFLVSVVAKFYKKLAIPVAIALSVYMMDSYSLRFDCSFLTESLYRNSLIAVVGFLILIINSRKKMFWLLFSAFLILPPLIRSNGLYIYFLPLILLIYLWTNKFPIKYYLLLVLPVFLLNIAWSVFNFSTEKQFFPGNPGRLNSIVNNLETETPDSAKIVSQIEDNYSKKTVFIDLTTNITSNRPQFYYTLLADAYRKYYISDMLHDSTYKRSDGTLPVDASLKKLALKEIYTEPNKYSHVIADFDATTTHNIWIEAYHIYYKIHSFLFNNYLLLFLFLAVYFVSAWQCIVSRFKNTNAFLLFCIGNIQIMAILSLTFFGWFQERYIQVTEFAVYLSFALLPLLFNKNKVVNRDK